MASGEPWGGHFAACARREGFHLQRLDLDGLNDRFECESLEYGAYLTPDLVDTGALD